MKKKHENLIESQEKSYEILSGNQKEIIEF